MPPPAFDVCVPPVHPAYIAAQAAAHAGNPPWLQQIQVPGGELGPPLGDTHTTASAASISASAMLPEMVEVEEELRGELVVALAAVQETLCAEDPLATEDVLFHAPLPMTMTEGHEDKDDFKCGDEAMTERHEDDLYRPNTLHAAELCGLAWAQDPSDALYTFDDAAASTQPRLESTFECGDEEPMLTVECGDEEPLLTVECGDEETPLTESLTVETLEMTPPSTPGQRKDTSARLSKTARATQEHWQGRKRSKKTGNPDVRASARGKSAQIQRLAQAFGKRKNDGLCLSHQIRLMHLFWQCEGFLEMRVQ